MATDIFIVSPRIDLPKDTRLEIEFEFDAGIEAIQEKSADGGLMEWKRRRQYRRNALIGGPNTAFIDRSTLAELVALAASVPGILLLSYIGDTIAFEFDYADGSPVSASPLVPRPNAADTDLYRNLKIKIIER